MAASGIAEHNEARRLDRVYNRRAYLARQEAEKSGVRNAEYGTERPDIRAYKKEMEYKYSMGRLPETEGGTVDQQRRMAHYNQMQQDYSAKLPNRYTSTDYMAQW